MRVRVGEMTVDDVGIEPQAVRKPPEKIFLDFFAESTSEGSDSDGIERLGWNRPNRTSRTTRLRQYARGRSKRPNRMEMPSSPAIARRDDALCDDRMRPRTLGRASIGFGQPSPSFALRRSLTA